MYLFSNVCRFGKHYELPLLLQSVVMIFTMLAMMHVCVLVKADQSTVARRLKGVANLVTKDFAPVAAHLRHCDPYQSIYLRFLQAFFHFSCYKSCQVFFLL